MQATRMARKQAMGVMPVRCTRYKTKIAAKAMAAVQYAQ